MAGLFSRLFGEGGNPQGTQQSVSIGSGWPDIEVEGEAYRRAEVSRLFLGIGRAEGGVTMQQAQLVPEPTNKYDRNAVKVVIRGEHVGYVPADLSARVAGACRALSRGSVAVVPARVWARVDGNTWRARVTLAFTGTSEDEQDYAAQRVEIEELEAQRAAASALKIADREAREAAKLARREAGTVRGEYWTTWKPSIAEMKRQQRLDEAKEFLVECRDAVRRESVVTNEVADPWPTEQLAAVTRRLGDPAGELATPEEYVVDCGARDVPDSIIAKISKARIASESVRWGSSSTSNPPSDLAAVSLDRAHREDEPSGGRSGEERMLVGESSRSALSKVGSATASVSSSNRSRRSRQHSSRADRSCTRRYSKTGRKATHF